MPTGIVFPLQPSGQWLITLVQVFFGCPHRFPPVAEWQRLCVDIPSLYSRTSEQMVGPLFLKSCAIGAAALTALSAEFAMIATAYDIVNIYEEDDGTSSKIVCDSPSTQNLSDQGLQLMGMLLY